MEPTEEFRQIKHRQFKRPELLTWLCILSFIGSGLAAISNLFIFLSYDEMVNLTEEINLDLPEFELMMSGVMIFFLQDLFCIRSPYLEPSLCGSSEK